MATTTIDTGAGASAGHLRNVAELAARVLLAGLFLVSGFGKITGYTGIEAYMTAVGVPAALLPVVIVTELLGGLALVAGWQTRIVAFLLSGFSILSALVFHHDFSNQIEMLMFLKNLSIAGGLLLLVIHGAGHFSLDQRR